MKSIKRSLGIVWILLGPAAIFFLVQNAAEKIAAKPTQDVILPWLIILLVFAPIAVGMVIFGWYALKGEYDNIEPK